MLTIRDDQLLVFAAMAHEQALNRAVLGLQRENEQSDRPLAEQDLRELAEHGMKLAPAFGIVGDAALRRWLLLLLKLGRDLDELPMPGYLLRRPAMTAETRLDAVEAWDQARQQQLTAAPNGRSDELAR
jgi:hypothetical protein